MQTHTRLNKFSKQVHILPIAILSIASISEQSRESAMNPTKPQQSCMQVCQYLQLLT